MYLMFGVVMGSLMACGNIENGDAYTEKNIR